MPFSIIAVVMASDPFIDRPISQSLPQFRLRTLFLVVTYLAVVFALMGVIGPIASTALLLLLAMIALHVAGNALGTRLRDETSAQVLKHQLSPDLRRRARQCHGRAKIAANGAHAAGVDHSRCEHRRLSGRRRDRQADVRAVPERHSTRSDRRHIFARHAWRPTGISSRRLS